MQTKTPPNTRGPLAVFADRGGVTAIEYGLIAGLIVVVIFTTLEAFTNTVHNLFTMVATSVSNAIG